MANESGTTNAPEFIFLQDGGYDEPLTADDYNGHEDLTWCRDEIESGDTKYIRFDEHELLITAANARADEAVEAMDWIRRKLDLPADTQMFTGQDTIAGKMHNICYSAHGYKTYIEAYKCEDKQGEIARLTVAKEAAEQSLAEVRRENERLRNGVDNLLAEFGKAPGLPLETCSQEDLEKWTSTIHGVLVALGPYSVTGKPLHMGEYLSAAIEAAQGVLDPNTCPKNDYIVVVEGANVGFITKGDCK